MSGIFHSKGPGQSRATQRVFTLPRRALGTILLGSLLVTCLSCGKENTASTNSRTLPPISSSDSTFPVTLTDAIGETVTIDAPPQRIITLAPNLTEMVYAMGGGNRLVGRTDYCNYPPETAQLPSVGSMLTLQYETILSLHPDLIIMSHAGNTEGNYRKLKDLGLNVFALGASTIPHVINSIDTVGILIGNNREAHNLSAHLRKTVDSIHALAKASAMVDAFILIDKAPLVTVSSGFIAEALELAGGRNIAAGAVTPYPTYNREELLRQNPEVLFVVIYSDKDSTALMQDLLATYPEWKNLRAIRSGRTYVLPVDILTRPGPRIDQGLLILYNALHPRNTTD